MHLKPLRTVRIHSFYGLLGTVNRLVLKTPRSIYDVEVLITYPLTRLFRPWHFLFHN